MRKKMTRENNQRTRHKNPKFKDFYEEDFCEEDQAEMQQRRKKLSKRSQWKDTDKENGSLFSTMDKKRKEKRR